MMETANGPGAGEHKLLPLPMLQSAQGYGKFLRRWNVSVRN